VGPAGEAITGAAINGTVLVRALPAAPDPLALEARRASRSGGDECRQAPGARTEAESQQMLVWSRRGEGSGHTSCDILSPMATPSLAGKTDSDPSAVPSGVSAFVARVLDQLALSAWLPAAFLTTGIAVLLEFRSTKSASVPTAVEKLTAHSLQLLVLMIPLLVLATVVTQAFSFEAIRALEGYWRRRGIVSLAYRFMVGQHVRRKNAIVERRRRESATAFIDALPRVLYGNDEVNGRVVKAVVSALSGRNEERPKLEGKEVEVFTDTLRNWRDEVDAWRLARVDRLVDEQNSYPEDSRILPTKLGNLIRRTEDDLKHAGGDVRSFVLRQRDTVSYRIQIQHDQFRTRLDMYCTLVFVSVALAALAPAILVGRVGILALVITTGSFVVMAVTSYLAAIASARGYCTALKMMDEKARASAETSHPLFLETSSCHSSRAQLRTTRCDDTCGTHILASSALSRRPSCHRPRFDGSPGRSCRQVKETVRIRGRSAARVAGQRPVTRRDRLRSRLGLRDG
jgi:hypothetical protein